MALGFACICFAYTKGNVPDYTLLPFAFSLLIAFLSVDRSIIQKALSHRVLVYVGEVSYSTYMIHYFVYDVFKMGFVKDLTNVSQMHLMVSFLVVFIISIVVNHMIEVPAQRYLRNRYFSDAKQRWTSRKISRSQDNAESEIKNIGNL